MAGMTDETSLTAKYIPAEDASDSDEADMNISDEEGDDVPAKKARTDRGKADGESVPKWSNPDPYTAIPPPDLCKTKDVVKLIRKARVTNGNASLVTSQALEDDFISFDMAGDEDSDEADNHLPEEDSSAIESQRLPKTAAMTASIGFQALDKASDPALGSRKRTIRDEIVRAPSIYTTSGKGQRPSDGHVLSKWTLGSDMPAAPWLLHDHSDTPNMGFW